MDDAVFGPIIAYRAWLCRDGRLESVYFSSFSNWKPGRAAKAYYLDVSRQAGIHVVKHRHQIPGYLDLDLTHGPCIHGSVWVWGRVEEYSGGYLAEYAYPCRLFERRGIDSGLLKSLRELYGLQEEPCTLETTLEPLLSLRLTRPLAKKYVQKYGNPNRFKRQWSRFPPVQRQ